MLGWGRKGNVPDSVFQVKRKSTRHIWGNEHSSGWVDSEEGIQAKMISFGHFFKDFKIVEKIYFLERLLGHTVWRIT